MGLSKFLNKFNKLDIYDFRRGWQIPFETCKRNNRKICCKRVDVDTEAHKIAQAVERNFVLSRHKNWRGREQKIAITWKKT